MKLLKKSYVMLGLGMFLLAVGARAETEWTNKFEAGYNKGFFIKTQDEKFKLSITGYTQLMYELEKFENDSKDNINTFRVRRARLTFSGNTFTKKLTYKFQLDLTKPQLLDAFYQYAAFGESLNVRIGQWTIPMNRQQLVSSSKQQFNDRSLASKEFIPGTEIDADKDGVVEKTNKDGRDIGIGVNGKLFNKKLDYEVAIMNGNGVNTVNVNNELMYAGRVSYNVMGDYGYSESDLDHSDDPAVFVGGHGIYNVGEITQNKQIFGGFESGLKWKGLSVQGELMLRNTNATGVKDKNDYGYYTQAGYFVVPKKLEVAARASQVFYDGPRNDKAEFSLGVNYFVFKQNVKLQGDYSWMPDNTKTGVDNNHRVRLKLQASF